MLDKKATFLQATDAFANKINDRANTLYAALKKVDPSSLSIAAEFKDYFVNHHLGPRLFFSLQNSAHIIYDAVKQCKKNESDIVFIDYGAGLGTLYMLAGLMDFKQTIYNDYLPDWQQTAQHICEQLEIKIDAYVTGDIDQVMAFATTAKIRYDIIASRNVIEHIYHLPHFYQSIFRHNPNAITFSTTTANFHNPAMRLHHIRIHKTAEVYLLNNRKKAIQELHPQLNPNELVKIATDTRGRAQKDFTDAVQNLMTGKPVPPVPSLRSNTCDHQTGVWIEHLLTAKEHRQIIEEAGFKSTYYAGYWDTHYASSLMNVLGAALNTMIQLTGKQKGIVLAPFVNIVAHP